MGKKRREKKQKRPKNSMYLYGKNSILERLRADPGSVKMVLIEDNFRDDKVLEEVRRSGRPLKRVGERELMRTKHADRLQGIVAEVGAFKYTPIEDLIERGKRGSLSLVCLDSVSDPHNLGAILRITACFGGFAVVIPKYGSCEVNDTVMHVASGGENFVPVAMVNNLSTTLIEAKEAGYCVVGAMVGGGEDMTTAAIPLPVCLVLGSEGKGIRQGLKKHLDIRATLPMTGARLSFNVSMACALFCHEIARRRPA